MTASAADPYNGQLSTGLCGRPISGGQALEAIAPPQAATSTSSTISAAALPSATPIGLPLLSSRPGAPATLFLDFNGHVESHWGSYTNVVTRPYDLDGNYSSFSSSEVAAIREIWARVAEDYAPFNINVTTVAPPVIANRRAVRLAIGGNYSDWLGSSAGGVAYVGGFANSSPNVGYVFEDALNNGNPRLTAEAVSHEAGHLFGLSHQAAWSGNQLVTEYNSGTANWAPTMGVGYYASRTTWNRGPTSTGPTSVQDDLAVLAGPTNGFGYARDDYGSTLASASPLRLSGASIVTSGLIGQSGDKDVFKFTTRGGSLSISLSVAQFGANLDATLELVNATGKTIAASSPTGSLGASVATTIGAGTYYVVVRSSGGYGNLGRYTLSGAVPAPTTSSSSTIYAIPTAAPRSPTSPTPSASQTSLSSPAHSQLLAIAAPSLPSSNKQPPILAARPSTIDKHAADDLFSRLDWLEWHSKRPRGK
jgi:hypothetical protein